MSTIRKTFEVNGTPTDMTSVKLSDRDGTYGVKRNDTDAVVVADDTAMSKISTGVYETTFTDPADDLTYTYWLEVVYGGETRWIEGSFDGPTSASSYDLVTAAQAKTYLGISASTYDTLLARMATAATAEMERYCGREFVEREHAEWIDGELPYAVWLAHYPVTRLDRLCCGVREVLRLSNTSADASYATARTTSTGLTLTVGGGDNAGSDTLLWADYATVTLLTAAINALGSGWSAEILLSRGSWPTSDLRPGTVGCLNNGVSGQQADLYAPGEPVPEAHVHDGGEVVCRAGYLDGSDALYAAYLGGYAEGDQALEALEQIALELISRMWHTRKSNPLTTAESLDGWSATYTTEARSLIGGDPAMRARLDMYRRVSV